MLIRAAILRSIIWCFTMLYFTVYSIVYSTEPVSAYVIDNGGSFDSRAGEIILQNEYLKPISQWMDIEVTVELESNSLNEDGKIELGSRILYLISIFNGTEITVFDALLVAKVPQNTLFIVEESDSRWNAALLMDRYQKSPERSCPDRHPPGLECTIELGDLGPDERVTTIRYVVEVNGNIAKSVETIDLRVELLGSLTDNGPLDVSERATNSTMLARPTALPVASEPLFIFDARENEIHAKPQRPELDLPIPPQKYYIYIPWVIAQ